MNSSLGMRPVATFILLKPFASLPSVLPSYSLSNSLCSPYLLDLSLILSLKGVKGFAEEVCSSNPDSFLFFTALMRLFIL